MRKIKKFLLYILAIIFPWLVLFFNDNPGGALLALVLQATLIGWIPASMWAIRVIRGDQREKPAGKNISEEKE